VRVLEDLKALKTTDTQISLPADIADWIEQPKVIPQLRQWIAKACNHFRHFHNPKKFPSYLAYIQTQTHILLPHRHSFQCSIISIASYWGVLLGKIGLLYPLC